MWLQVRLASQTPRSPVAVDQQTGFSATLILELRNCQLPDWKYLLYILTLGNFELEHWPS